MENIQLINELKDSAKSELKKNQRFHDYAHAISVFHNAKKIIKGEKLESQVNPLTISAAAFFHDISNLDKRDSLDSAKKVSRILLSIDGFPRELIKEVVRLISSLERGHMNNNSIDEIIINDADNLEALSKLSICRGFMLCGKRGWKLHDTILDFRNLVDKKVKGLSTNTAKKIGKKESIFIKRFLDDCLEVYKA